MGGFGSGKRLCLRDKDLTADHYRLDIRSCFSPTPVRKTGLSDICLLPVLIGQMSLVWMDKSLE